MAVSVFEDFVDGYWIRKLVSQYLDSYLGGTSIWIFLPLELTGQLSLRPYGASEIPVKYYRTTHEYHLLYIPKIIEERWY